MNAQEAVDRLGPLLTVCERCAVPRSEHGNVGHNFQGISNREAVKMVETEMAS